MYHVEQCFNHIKNGDVLRDLVLFVQFKRCYKCPYRSVTFIKVAGGKRSQKQSLKSTLDKTCFERQ